MVDDGHQLMVPVADRWWPEAVVVETARRAGRRYRCPTCGARVWTAFGRARAHRVQHARELLEAAGYTVTEPSGAGAVRARMRG